MQYLVVRESHSSFLKASFAKLCTAGFYFFYHKLRLTLSFYQPGYRSSLFGEESPDSKGQHTG
jgi:hypothetical protein